MSKYREKLAISIIILLIPAFQHKMQAQDFSPFCLGTFHSPKGFGLCYENNADELSFDSFSLIADMFGVLTGDHPRPGIKATYTRNVIIKHYDKDGYYVDIYAGPGLTAGYAKDIRKPYCLIAGLSGVAGSRFSFSSMFSVSIELCADIALDVSRNQRSGTLDLGLYKSGIYHMLFPQLRIQYSFR